MYLGSKKQNFNLTYMSECLVIMKYRNNYRKRESKKINMKKKMGKQS